MNQKVHSSFGCDIVSKHTGKQIAYNQSIPWGNYGKKVETFEQAVEFAKWFMDGAPAQVITNITCRTTISYTIPLDLVLLKNEG